MFRPSSRQESIKYSPPTTFLVCNTCGTEHNRQFQENDYVSKQIEEKCPKCGSSSMVISAIYVKEKSARKE